MGRALIWDVTVADTVTASYLPCTSVAAADAAGQAVDRKCTKHDFLSKTYHFVPLACKTLGPINNSGHLFITEFGAWGAISFDRRQEINQPSLSAHFHHNP